MARTASISEDDHIVFLLSCVRHSNLGQVNFNNVATECQIVTGSAASKRFSRLNKKYQNGGNDGSTTKVEEGIEEGPEEDPTIESAKKPASSKASPKKANRSGKGVIKTETDSKDPMAVTGPRAAKVTKKRSSPTKAQATTDLNTAVVKSEHELDEAQAHETFTSSFFDAEMGGEATDNENEMV